MGWTPLDGIDVPKWRCRVSATEEASVEFVGTTGIDLAKHVFQLQGAAADRTVLFQRKLRREKLLDFLAAQPACVVAVAMEACASAHYWGREIGRLGHEVRLIAPAYVKPF
jgi:transposase